METKTLDLLPAYGRVYATAEEALRDWSNGKDFLIWKGPYVNKTELPYIKYAGYTHIHLIWNICHNSLTFRI